jgi:2-polyprenyl-3-methyl-5-hydroxy-6-metoxy-1,4-benzoquinol methylase
LQEHNSKTYISTKDFLVSGESFSLLLDEEREMLITDPQPKESELGAYYESSDYISHTDSKKGLLAFLYQNVKKRSLQKKAKLIKKLNHGSGSLLDIGAGTGEFCKVAQKSGWTSHGVEPNKKARTYSKSKGIDLNAAMEFYSGQEFDVVTLWHVLEHLPNLEESIHRISSLVRPGGTLVIAVPNFKSFDAKFYKSFWAAYDVPRHLWHFSKASMPILFAENFELIKTQPMVFDSFYVSLLSEKYKSGNKFSIMAIFVGLWSNVHGWRTKEHSSHVYCFKKTRKKE